MSNNVEKALAYIRALSDRNPALATEFMHPAHYVEHSPNVGEGVAGVQEYVEKASAASRLQVVRTIEDGSHVVTQSDGLFYGHGTFFDVFRFDNGLIVEHWSFSAPAAPPNQSSHTQADGPVAARPDVDTDKTKTLGREYYQTVHIEGRHDMIPHYVSDDHVRHEPGVADGRDAFARDLEIITKDRTIDQIVLLLGQGDFVFFAVKGTHLGEPCVYVDLYRVEGKQLVEHWGFPEPVPPPEKRKNGNRML